MSFATFQVAIHTHQHEAESRRKRGLEGKRQHLPHQTYLRNKSAGNLSARSRGLRIRMQQKFLTCSFTASFPPIALSGRVLGIRAREDDGGGSCIAWPLKVEIGSRCRLAQGSLPSTTEKGPATLQLTPAYYQPEQSSQDSRQVSAGLRGGSGAVGSFGQTSSHHLFMPSVGCAAATSLPFQAVLRHLSVSTRHA